MSKASHPYFIPNGDEGRKATAILLVGTATEFGIDQHDIEVTQGGFNVTEAIARAVYGEDFTPEAPEDDFPTYDFGKPRPEGWSDFTDEEKFAYVYGKDPVMEEADALTDAGDSDEDGDEDGDEDDSLPDYDSWEYADLKSAVNTRNIAVENQQKPTLVAALIAADEAEAASGDDTE